MAVGGIFRRFAAVIAVLALVAACGDAPARSSESLPHQPDGDVSTTMAGSPSSVPASVAGHMPTTTTSAAAPETTTTAPVASTTKAPEDDSPADPEALPTFEELKEASEFISWDNGAHIPYPDARVRSRFAVRYAEPDMKGWIDIGILLTFVGDVVVMDLGDVIDEVDANPELGSERTVEQGTTYWELHPSGKWTSSEIGWERGQTPFILDWETAQHAASGFFENGAEEVGWEEVAGRPAMRIIAPSDETRVRTELWIDTRGFVVKLYGEQVESPPNAANTIVIEWEVLEFEPRLKGPLPRGIGGAP